MANEGTSPPCPSSPEGITYYIIDDIDREMYVFAH